MTEIPTKRYAQKTKKSVIAAAMAKAWVLMNELLQHDNFLTRALERELAVFTTIVENFQLYCLAKLDKEKYINKKGCKAVKLSSDKLEREYNKFGGKAISLPCPKCSHSLCDKEPDFDDNAKVNKSITKAWKAKKKHLEEFNCAVLRRQQICSQILSST